MKDQPRRSGGLTDDQLCNDRPCTCGAAIHDPVQLIYAARVLRSARARRLSSATSATSRNTDGRDIA